MKDITRLFAMGTGCTSGRFFANMGLRVVLLLGLIPLGWTAQGDWLRGVEAIDDALPWLQTEAPFFRKKLDRIVEIHVTSRDTRPLPEGIELLLSREIYPAEDGHLDAVVWLDVAEDQPVPGALRVTLKDEAGDVVSTEQLDPIPGNRIFFSQLWPEAWADTSGTLRVDWLSSNDGKVKAHMERGFSIQAPQPVEKAGRIRLAIPNTPAAVAYGVPVTVGVPFPRGALTSADHLRLVDDAGVEIPLQTKVTATWSRFGSIKWVLCDFVADLSGTDRTFYLEYDPTIRREAVSPLVVDKHDGRVLVDTGIIRFGDGLELRNADGNWQPLLTDGAFSGAFVEHANDRRYSGYAWRRENVPFGGLYEPIDDFQVPRDTPFTVEEEGPVKIVLRQEGWYRKPPTGPEEDAVEFCRFVIRYVLHRDSPVVRIFHTWIFTGDSNRDRISNMGWRFPLADDLTPTGFLDTFGPDGQWVKGRYLLQHDYDQYEIIAGYSGRHMRQDRVLDGGRGPGVMAAGGEGTRLYLGIKDFWQNYPSELEFGEDGRQMIFHLWPRHPALGRERRPPRQEDAYRLWFAHQGDVLDFRLPREWTEGEFYLSAHLGERHWHYGRPESVNAQGIAKTTEMWLYATDNTVSDTHATRLLQGLNDETVRAVVDPAWLMASGAFFEAHHYDPDRFPRDEEAYKLQAANTAAQVERMGAYGKWLYGEILRTASLEDRTASDLYRIFRKGHWGWPYSWMTFARTGDPALLKFAQASTRYMSDIVFCHYVSDEVRDFMTALPGQRTAWGVKQPFREKGWHNRGPLPWAGFGGPSSRSYENQAEYLLHAWYLTGYRRALDVAQEWVAQTKYEPEEDLPRRSAIPFSGAGDRPGNTLIKEYIGLYEATFDPWFLVAAHAIADMHVHEFRTRDGGYRAHSWDSGPREFLRFSGRADYREFFLHTANQEVDWHRTGWATTPSILIDTVAYAWQVTGEELFLRRVLGLLDLYDWSTFRAAPDHFRGYTVRRGTHDDILEKGWYLKEQPRLLQAVVAAEAQYDALPPLLPLAFAQDMRAGYFLVEKNADIPLLFRPGGAFRVEDAAGETVMEGPSVRETEIPAEAPAGIYRIEVRGRSVTVPITPPGTKEVMHFPDGAVGEGGDHFVQHWFKVPTGLTEFEVAIDNRMSQPVQQIIVWNAQGEPAWTLQRTRSDVASDEDEVVARIEVPEGHDGQLWRITNPGGRSGVPGFRLDERIPPVVAHDPSRWFAWESP